MKKVKFGVEIEFLVKNFEKLKKLHISLENSKFKDFLIKNKDEKGGFNLFFKDSSVEDDERFASFGVEIKTIPLDYTTENLSKILYLLYFIEEYSYTNHTCSIHVHSSIEGYSIKDNYKLLYDYLKYKKDKELLTYDDGIFELHNNCYANYKKCRQKYLYSINSAIRNKTMVTLKPNKERKDSLYEVRGENFKTIEYRGLRGHFSELDNEAIISLIEKYLKNMIYCAKNPSDTNLDETVNISYDYF